ncbi:MAG: cytochrome c-type biogenesis protein CcmH [Candidatus Marinimicrobia bacterium]|nr:cytochrome c-type biogenesis protein CcmH [Candidatus Neomarinimicrobiota bacterium]
MNKFIYLFLIASLFCVEFKSQRQYQLEQQLHAPCCWGGVIAEHDSPIANGIKLIIKNIISDEFDKNKINNTLLQVYNKNVLDYSNKFIKQNMTDEEIINFFVGIEGEKIRALPENKGLGWVAWKLPTFILFLSILMGIIIINRFRALPKEINQNKKNISFEKVDDEMKKMGF